MRPRILVTRPNGESAELCALLDSAGLEPVAVPTIAIDDSIADGPALASRVADADWLVATSAHGADLIARALTRELAGARPDRLRIAAVGPATAAALTAWGVDVDAVPRAHRSMAIPDELGSLEGRRVVLARAEAADPDLPRVLADRGARVDDVALYRVIEGPDSSARLLRQAVRRGLDGISFTSGSTVRGLIGLATSWERARLAGLPAFCIGPPTAEVARRSGFGISGIASPHTSAGLAAAVTRHFVSELP